MRNHLFGGVAAVALMIPAAAAAQETTSSIRGIVEANGAPVTDVQVTVRHEPSGTTNTVTTDATGNFNAAGLRIGGPFTVTATAPGYEEQSVTGISLTAGQPFRLQLSLTDAAEEIVVTGTRGPAREVSNGPITTLTREEIEGVASINRDIRDIARRDPLVSLDPTNRAIEIAGQNGRFNRFSVDGVQFADDFGLNQGGLPTGRGPVPYDAIEQLSVKIAPYDVSEGDFQGGAINVVLRSGTNNFTGSGFFTYSDDNLTGSRTRGRDLNLDFESKQYGGLLAGPLIRDRLFFMVAYERTDEALPFDNGIGSGFANQVPGVTQAQVDQVSQIARDVYDFDTLGLIQNANERDEKFAAKIDWNITDNQRASLTYIRNLGTQQFQQNTFLTPPPALGLQSNGYELREEINSGVFQLNSTWTDTFSTEFRASYRDYNRDQTPFGGRDIAQFEVCLDPVTGGNITACEGTRLFFGPDISRQSNDLNTDNLSLDFTARLSAGDHNLKLQVGYTDIDTYNLFLQRSLGDLYFDSIADFQARRVNRLRLGGAVPTLDVNDAAAIFTTQNWTFGVQDDWDVTPSFQLQYGVRYDLFNNPELPPLNLNFLQRQGFSNRTTFNGRGAFQPRIGFNWTATDRLIVRGGAGIFAGGTPDVYLSNSFSNTGQLTNAIDITRANCAASGTCAGLDGVTGRGFPGSITNFLVNNTASLALAPVNALDPDLKLASLFRSNLSINYDADLGALGDGWLFGLDGIYGETVNAYTVTDLRSVPIGTLPDGRTRYGPLNGVATNNQDLLITNDSRGRTLIGVARIEKRFDFGLGIRGSYTRTDVRDTNALTSSTSGSLYGNNAFVDPNFAAYGRSIYEFRDQYKFAFDYNHAFFGDYQTRFSLFGEYRSGRPYSAVALDRSTGRLPVWGTLGNGGRGLLYVPEIGDTRVSFDSAASETVFNQLVDQLGLERGRIQSKNSLTSPDFFKVDLHVSQEIPTFVGRSRIKVFADIENVLNLINSDWGSLRQVEFPYTAALVDVQCLTAPTPTGTAGPVAANPAAACAQYRYSRVTAPNEVLQTRQSLYQIRIGARIEF